MLKSLHLPWDGWRLYTSSTINSLTLDYKILFHFWDYFHHCLRSQFLECLQWLLSSSFICQLFTHLWRGLPMVGCGLWPSPNYLYCNGHQQAGLLWYVMLSFIDKLNCKRCGSRYLGRISDTKFLFTKLVLFWYIGLVNNGQPYALTKSHYLTRG